MMSASRDEVVSGRTEDVVEQAGLTTSIATPEHPMREVALSAMSVGLAIGISVMLAALLLELNGQSAIDAFTSSGEGVLGHKASIGTTLNRAVPFALAGLGFGIAFRTGLFNIGAEGQIFVGAAAAAAIALKVGPSVGGPLGIGLAFVAGAAAGACLSLVAAALYLRRRVSIILSTLLLNFVAIQLVSYLVRTPNLLQESGTVGDDEGYSGTTRRFAQSDQISSEFRLPEMIPGTGAHLGLLVAVLALAGVVLMFRYTSLGFRMRLLGAGPDAAEHAGLNVERTIGAAMALSGALGGTAGVVIVLGDRFRLLESVSDGFGFIAILAAMLARSSPAGTVAGAVFFAALQRGGQVMEAGGHAPEVTVLIIQGCAVLLIATAFEIRRRRDSHTRGLAV